MKMRLINMLLLSNVFLYMGAIHNHGYTFKTGIVAGCFPLIIGWMIWVIVTRLEDKSNNGRDL